MREVSNTQPSNVIRWTFLDDIEKKEEFSEVKPLQQKEERDMKQRISEHFIRHQKAYVTSAMALAGVLYPTIAMAAPESAEAMGGRNIIILLQKASFWVGMGITIWGIVESMLDFPGWKGRIAKGILGYIGILLVPLVFVELQNSLQVDVWQQIDGRGVNQ